MSQPSYISLYPPQLSWEFDPLKLVVYYPVTDDDDPTKARGNDKRNQKLSQNTLRLQVRDDYFLKSLHYDKSTLDQMVQQCHFPKLLWYQAFGSEYGGDLGVQVPVYGGPTLSLLRQWDSTHVYSCDTVTCRSTLLPREDLANLWYHEISQNPMDRYYFSLDNRDKARRMVLGIVTSSAHAQTTTRTALLSQQWNGSLGADVGMLAKIQAAWRSKRHNHQTELLCGTFGINLLCFSMEFEVSDADDSIVHVLVSAGHPVYSKAQLEQVRCGLVKQGDNVKFIDFARLGMDGTNTGGFFVRIPPGETNATLRKLSENVLVRMNGDLPESPTSQTDDSAPSVLVGGRIVLLALLAILSYTIYLLASTMLSLFSNRHSKRSEFAAWWRNRNLFRRRRASVGEGTVIPFALGALISFMLAGHSKNTGAVEDRLLLVWNRILPVVQSLLARWDGVMWKLWSWVSGSVPTHDTPCDPAIMEEIRSQLEQEGMAMLITCPEVLAEERLLPFLRQKQISKSSIQDVATKPNEYVERLLEWVEERSENMERQAVCRLQAAVRGFLQRKWYRSVANISKSLGSFQLHVQKLDASVTEKMLRDELSSTIPNSIITSVRVMRDPRNGQSLGFGFVGFSTLNDAMRVADELNGKTIANRSIFVDLAAPNQVQRALLHGQYDAHDKRLEPYAEVPKWQGRWQELEKQLEKEFEHPLDDNNYKEARLYAQLVWVTREYEKVVWTRDGSGKADHNDQSTVSEKLAMGTPETSTDSAVTAESDPLERQTMNNKLEVLAKKLHAAAMERAVASTSLQKRADLEISKALETFHMANVKLRQQYDSIKREHEALKEEYARLKELKTTPPLTASNHEVQQQLNTLQAQLLKMKDDLKERQAYYMTEAHVRLAYQKTLVRIVGEMQDRCHDPQLIEDVVVWALECESEAKSEYAALGKKDEGPPMDET